MSSRPELKLDWCSHAAAKYAVEHWHYSKTLPAFGRRVAVGVWEGGLYIGAIIFAYSATPNIAKHWKVKQTEIVELRRVALRKHAHPVSRMLAIAIRMLKSHCPKLRLLISFSDLDQQHHGGIYQATNWIYTGKSMDDQKDGYNTSRGFIHCRTAGTMGRNTLEWVKSNVDADATDHISIGKHCYLMPLDDEMRQRIEPLRKPYPKRAGSDTTDTPAFPAGEGGSTPTPALQSSAVT
jgi:hypothetical protein